MGYITNADIEERVGSVALVQLAEDDGNGVADVGVVDEARLGAGGEVNSYLGRRYAVPISLTTHPDLADVLASITLDLAEYRLRSRHPPVPQDARRRRDQAIEWLTRAAVARIELPSALGVAASTARGVIAVTTGEKRVLTRNELADH